MLSRVRLSHLKPPECRPRCTVKTLMRGKSSSARCSRSKPVAALKTASTALSRRGTTPSSKLRRCSTRARLWMLPNAPKTLVPLGTWDKKIRVQDSNAHAIYTLHMQKPLLITSFLYCRFCMGAAWRDLKGRKSNFSKIVGYVKAIR